jgi:hypothetical protein
MTTELEKQRREAIALFLNVTGPPNERFFLWWDGRDSFFDEDVQEVLKARRPTDATKAPWEQLDYPIQAWSDADTFRLVNSEKTFDLGNIKAWMCGRIALGS